MTDPAIETVTLQSCDAEPIHIPGTIQSHGALLVLHPDTWKITHASSNTASILAIPHEDLLDRELSACLGREISHTLTNALTTSLGPSLPGRTFGLELSTKRICDVTIHRHESHVLVEFEPARPKQDEALPLLLVRAMLTRMQQAQTVQGICDAAAEQLRALIGFDRVMVYRFLHDGSGSVVAERKRTEQGSFLGHHYPASDIPAQARALYVKNWLRLIADVDATPVPLQPGRSADVVPVDLSFCALRSVSPIHLEYLRNMGVAASASISVVVGGRLWGMIACHHSFPRVLTAETRVAAELFGQAFSLQLQVIERLDATEMLRTARSRLDRLVSQLPTSGSLLEGLSLRLPELATVVPSDGAGLWIGGTWRGFGVTPPESAIATLAEHLKTTAGQELFATHKLVDTLPSAADYADRVSGVLAVPLSRSPGDYLLFFRREFVHTIEWAGQPVKLPAAPDTPLRLSPRKSFEVWRDEVRSSSRVWEPSDKLAAEALRISLLEVVLRFTEVVVQERAKVAAQQRVFVAELNHRVKNALALVGALVKQSRGAHDNVPSFIADLEGRILSLAKAHDQANSRGSLDLRLLLETELAPFGGPCDRRVHIEGPPLLLDSRRFAVLALVFHEMTTNAAKHGSLSVPEGTIDVRWHLDDTDHCVVVWTERHGPHVRPPSRNGFGSKLITHQIPFELGGSVNIVYAPDGINILLRFDPKATSILSAAGAALPGVVATAVPHSAIEDKTILVVEDSLLVALETEDLLRHAGASHVAVCATSDQALAMLKTFTPDAAVLDINLNSGTSLPVADALAAAGVPFVFATGYGTARNLPLRFNDIPVLTKPFTIPALAKTIENAIELQQQRQGGN